MTIHFSGLILLAIMNEPTQNKREDGAKASNPSFFALENLFPVIGISAALNFIAYITSFFIEKHGIATHVSCVIGLLSLFFAAWGLFMAGNIKKTLLIRSIIEPLEKLKNKYDTSSQDGTILYLNKSNIIEALEILDFALKSGNSLPKTTKDAIRATIEYLEKYKNDSTAEKPMYSVLSNRLKTIIASYQ